MRLYVGNISFRITEPELAEFFGTVGPVDSVTIIEDAVTGRSRGFGFVEMSTPTDADAAIELLNGKELDGRQLKINPAKPSGRSGRRSRDDGNAIGGYGTVYGNHNSSIRTDYGGRSW